MRKAVLLAVFVAVAGCSDGGDESPFATVAQQELDGVPQGYTATFGPGTWRLADDPSPDAVELRVLVAIGGCVDLSHVELAEHSDAVEVVAVVRILQPKPGFGCDAMLTMAKVDVPLAEPIGRRDISGECQPDDPLCDALAAMSGAP